MSDIGQVIKMAVNSRVLARVIHICDAIKQNQSEVGQNQFPFFKLMVYIICKATFC